jgi:hypothetical protein
MARTPRPHRPAVGDQPSSHVIGDPSPSEVYPLKTGGRAVPDRSREPGIGAASHDTRKTAPAPAFTDELRSGVELGTTVGDAEPVPKATMEFGDARRQARGVRTRPVRPGRASYG